MNTPRDEERIKTSALMGISILFENDLYELARFVLKIFQAQDEEANRKSSGTRRSPGQRFWVWLTSTHI